jgi:hypothetical protein
MLATRALLGSRRTHVFYRSCIYACAVADRARLVYAVRRGVDPESASRELLEPC